MKIPTVYCYRGLWSVKIRTMSAGKRHYHVNLANDVQILGWGGVSEIIFKYNV